MHSFIFYSSTQPERLSAISKFILENYQISLPELSDQKSNNNPDIFLINPLGSIGIEEVRNLKISLSKKPIAGVYKLVLIQLADRLTPQAQHALLKTLEEPTPNTILILELQNPHALLPTILSRCQMFETITKKRAFTPSEIKKLEFLKSILPLSPGKKLVKIKEISNLSQAEELFLTILKILQSELPTNPNWIQAIKTTQAALFSLKSNLNLKLTLEHWALTLKPNKINPS